MTTATFTVPRLETERLVLREPRPADFETYATQMTDAEARKFAGGPMSRREAWRQYLVCAGSWIVTQSGWWMIEERASGEVVGMVGAFFREWNLDKAELEVGWSVYRPAWNRRFAREAAAAAMDWAVLHHDPARVVAHVNKENLASIAVTRALGMKPAGTVDFYGEPNELFVIQRR